MHSHRSHLFCRRQGGARTSLMGLLLTLPTLWTSAGPDVLSAAPVGPQTVKGAVNASAPVLTSRATTNDTLARTFEVTLQSPADVRVQCDEVGGDQERHLKMLPAGEGTEVTIRGLKPSTRYQCHAVALDGAGLRSQPVQFVTAALPFGLVPPVVTVPSTDVAATGYTMYNYGLYRNGFKNNYLVILDAKGQVRWYQPGPGAGDLDSSYLGDDRILYGGMSGSYYPPTIIGLDKVVQWKGTTQTVTPEEVTGQTNHDSGLSADGQSIFHLNHAYLDDYWLVFVIKQIDLATNQVIWSWDSITDGLDAGVLPPGGSSYDLYHANTIYDQWEDGRLYLYVSLRNFHKVLKIDYLTSEVVWQLGVGGDFTLLEEDGTPADSNARWFFNQHDVQLDGPGFLTMYDNGSERNDYGATDYSRALQLELDQDARTARIVFEYSEPEWVEPWWGGYDVLDNGNSVIAMGHFGGSSIGHNSALVELNPEGTVVWRADFRTSQEGIYRSERIGGCDIFDNVAYCPRLAKEAARR